MKMTGINDLFPSPDPLANDKFMVEFYVDRLRWFRICGRILLAAAVVIGCSGFFLGMDGHYGDGQGYGLASIGFGVAWVTCRQLTQCIALLKRSHEKLRKVQAGTAP